MARWFTSETSGGSQQGSAYAAVFFAEAFMFVAAAWLAAKVSGPHAAVQVPPTDIQRTHVPGVPAGGSP